MTLAYLSNAGYVVLAIAVLLGAIGAPLPLSVALTVAGAMARQGRLDFGLLFLLCLIAAVAGDCLGYCLGRFALARLRLRPVEGRFLRVYERLMPQTSAWYPKMNTTIFLTRWAFTLPGPIVNIVAGVRRHPWRSFLVVDTCGELVWCTSTLVPGYVLGAAGQLGTPLALVAGLLFTVAFSLLAKRGPAVIGGHTMGSVAA